MPGMAAGAGICEDTPAGRVGGGCGDGARGWVPTCRWRAIHGATTSAGSVACGTYQNAAEIIWTTDAKNVLSYIRASNTDVPTLFQWWQANG